MAAAAAMSDSAADDDDDDEGRDGFGRWSMTTSLRCHRRLLQQQGHYTE